MLNTKALKAEMVRNGYTQATFADVLGITPRTFSTRLKTGNFTAKEIETMIETLKLDDFENIFFAREVT